MKYLKYILLLLLLIIVGGSIYVATLDSDFEVTRSRTINAPAEVVFKNVADYKNWPSWSPWIEKDTLTELTL
ncbi:MAG: SRPBCC family protein [Flavobacteriaceae bacterium]